MLDTFKKFAKFYSNTAETLVYNLPQFTASVLVPVVWFL